MTLQRFLSLAALWSAPPALAGPSWSRIDSEHFVVYSDKGGEQAGALASELEIFRVILTQAYPDLTEDLRRPALPVMAFGNSDEFAQFVSEESSTRNDRGVLGVYRTSGARPLVAVDASRWTDSSSEVYRNYVETLLERRPRAAPWLVEGLSEFFSTTRVERDNARVYARIGTPLAANLDLLRTEKWIPLDHILAADHQSPLLRNAKRRALFRAEAWLLVHWCQLDPTGTRRAQLTALTERARRGGEVEATYFGAPTGDKDWLNDVLSAYFTEKRYDTYDVDLSEQMLAELPPSVTVPPVEVEYRLGQVLTYRKQYEQADLLFQHAMTVDATSWMPYDGLGMVADANFSNGAARRYFAAAVARAPNTAGPYFDHGESSRYLLNRKSAIASARASYEKAISFDPSLLDAYAGLADLAYRERNWTESVRWAGRGLQIDPHDSLLRAMLGRAQFAVGDLAHARVNTQLALQECEDHRSCSEAAALVRVALSRL